VNDGSEFNPDVEYEDIMDADDLDDLDDEFENVASTRRLEDLKARGREAVTTAAEVGKQRLSEAAKRSKERLADKLEDTASQIDGRLYYSADYLRTSDIEVIRDDFVDLVRKRPLLSAGIALGAGYLVGKALGIGSGGGRKRGRVSRLKGQVGRAVVSGLATMVASRLRDNLLPAPEADAEPARRTPARKRQRSSRARTRAEYE